MNHEQQIEDRRVAYGLAKEILKKQNATNNEIQDCINLLPDSGNKALALRVRLQRKLDGLSDSWEP
tara:strand:- start:1383 stop:1580 length:198 start_codon:yes stop_codon:yes gene_type:complete